MHSNEYKTRQYDFVLQLRRRNPSVVISVAHDGASRFSYEGVFLDRWDKVTTVRDLSTWNLWRALFTSTRTASLVRWLLPRTIVDYNRHIDGREYRFYENGPMKIEPAFRDPRVTSSYARFHHSLSQELIRAKSYTVQALLLDIHWFSRQPEYAPVWWYDIILWTGNRRSISITSDRDIRLACFLREKWYVVFLPSDRPLRSDKDDDFDAGHITRFHAEEKQVDAIQIEVASKYRDPKRWDLSKQLTNDLAHFLNQEMT